VLKAGQIVKVKILTVDAKTKRIGLSIKALLSPVAAAPRPQRTAPRAPEPASMNDKLAALAGKWRVTAG